jgi:tetratricopeptide (TPR) repeat protein
VTAKADEAQAELAAQHSEAAAEAFRGALKACDGDLAGHSSMGAKAASKLGDLAVWNEAKERAASEYALAISWDPTQVDDAQIMNSIGNEGLISCLKEGCQGFEARYGDRNPAEATPLWWLGFVQFNEKQYADADLTFERVLGLYPAFTNSWWYRAEARFHQSDIDGFLECVRGLGAYGMEALAAQVNTDYTRNITVLGGAIKKLNDSGRFLDAAYLCDIRTAANPKSWEFFDNAALFYREAACKLMGGPRRVMWKKDAAKLETAHSYFERSVAAYATAYEIDPTKPHLLNDKAVVLDYYFNRELDEAQRLYKRAVEQADALLEDSDSLGEFERSLAELAKRDGANNLKLLQRRLEREEKKRERDEKKKKKGEDG